MKSTISLFLGFIIFSCSPLASEEKTNSNLFKISEINLPLDDSTALDFIRTSYLFENDTEFLYHQNEFKKSIQVYNLDLEILEKEIKYPSTPPLGINTAQGILVINPDSVFIFPTLTVRGSLLINNRGDVLNRYMPPREKSIEESLINHISFGSMPTLLSKGKLRFIQLPMFDLSNPANISDEFKFEVSYDIEANTLEFVEESGFPSFYQDKIWPGSDLQVSRIEDDFERVIYSWKYFDSLCYFLDGQEFKVFGGSKFKNTEVKPFTMVPEPEIEDKAWVENSKYYGIYFDPYRKLYYRTFQFPGVYDKNVILKEIDAKKQFSVIVLDKDFKIIKEVVFPGGIYNVYRAFVGKKGFYLPKNNILNPELQENYLSIDVFDFTQDEEN
ncbi:MAG: DUF4221 domain-containing protein [Cyclobacteriaceae bacterium]|nr:DUF4221 domain-containing protein [Cyclobacteriaceae bacterium]